MKREKSLLRQSLFDIANLAVPLALVAFGVASNCSGRAEALSKPQIQGRDIDLRNYEKRKSEEKQIPIEKSPEEILHEWEQYEQTRVFPDYTEKDRQKAIEAVFGEARGLSQDPEYLESVASTFIARAAHSGKSISETIGERKQYSYLNKGSKNAVKKGNALKIARSNILEAEAYKRCSDAVDNVLKCGIDKDNLYTHYFVIDSSKTKADFPNWAKGDRIVPKKIVRHGDKTTRFYYLMPIEAAKQGHVYTGKI